MRRNSDKIALAALVVSLLCATVVAANIAPAVLGISSEQEDLASTQRDLARQADRADRLARTARQLARKITREAAKRRDQACRIDERAHLADVKRLRRIYAFLAGLPRSEYGTTLTVAIVRQLPEVEREARQDIAPPFCDEPGIGLPEPDPKLPKRRRFDHLLTRP